MMRINTKEELAERYIQILGRTDDLTLLVLRSHLLFEEQLTLFLGTAAHDPSPLEKCRFRFSQLAAVTQALTRASTDKSVWLFIENLNRLRNRLAHQLDVPKLEEEVRKLILLVPEHGEFDAGPPALAYKFSMAVARMGGKLQGTIYATLQQQGKVERAT